MKRTLTALLLAICLLITCCPTVYAAAGSADDPLISKSYGESWASALLTELLGKAKTRIEAYMTEQGGTDTSAETKVLPANSTVTLQP